MSPERLAEIREHLGKSKRRNIHKGSIWIKSTRDLLEEHDRLEAKIRELECERGLLVVEMQKVFSALTSVNISISKVALLR